VNAFDRGAFGGSSLPRGIGEDGEQSADPFR
jgi:hypothetical protein